MNTLTKEYFDERMDEIKIDIDGLATRVANGFSDLEKRLDVRERVVDSLEKNMTKVESALNVRL